MRSRSLSLARSLLCSLSLLEFCDIALVVVVVVSIVVSIVALCRSEFPPHLSQESH